MGRWRDYLKLLRKELVRYIFSLVKILIFLVKILGEVVGVRFVNLCLEKSTKIICCAMYLGRQSIYLRTRYDGWEEGMMRSSRGLESGQQLFSKVCVCVLFVSGFCCLVFQERVLWFWELQRTTTIHWVYKINHKRDGCNSL